MLGWLSTVFQRAIRTTRGRLALLLGIVGGLWAVSAAVDHLVFDHFSTYGDALWSALLHLLDPSTLQDDSSFSQRAVGLFQVIVGLIFLVGVLFTVLAEVVGKSLERLGHHDPPVRAHDHLVLVGGISLLPVIIGEIAMRADLPLGRESAPKAIVVLAPPAHRERRDQITAELRRRARGIRVDLVIGEATEPDDYALASARTARAVVLMPDWASSDVTDEEDFGVAQAGLALREHLEDDGGSDAPPNVFVLFQRGMNVDTVRELMPAAWHALVGDRGLAAVLRVAITRPRFTPLLPSVDPRRADRLIIRPAHDEVVGLSFGELAGRFRRAVPLGIVRVEDGEPRPVIAPAPSERIAASDRLILLSHGPDGLRATERPRLVDPPLMDVTRPESIRGIRRVLIVGWNVATRALIDELGEASATEQFEVTVMAPPEIDPNRRPILPPANVRFDWRVSLPDPVQLTRAVHDTQPHVVVVAATTVARRGFAAADTSARLAILHVRRVMADQPVPIVAVLFEPLSKVAMRSGPDPMIQAISSVDLTALGVAFSVLAPEAAATIDALFGGADVRLEAVEFAPPDGRPSTFGAVYQGLLRERGAAFGLQRATGSHETCPSFDAELVPGDGLLVVRAVSRATR